MSLLKHIEAELCQDIEDIARLVQETGGRAFLVGGSVRDALLKTTVTDADIEVYGIEAGELETLLKKHYTVDAVGASFGVFKLRGRAVDIALPREESKNAPGHRGFEVTGTQHCPLKRPAAAGILQ